MDKNIYICEKHFGIDTEIRARQMAALMQLKGWPMYYGLQPNWNIRLAMAETFGAGWEDQYRNDWDECLSALPTEE